MSKSSLGLPLNILNKIESVIKREKLKIPRVPINSCTHILLSPVTENHRSHKRAAPWPETIGRGTIDQKFYNKSQEPFDRIFQGRFISLI
jgi:hypothetical protein